MTTSIRMSSRQASLRCICLTALLGGATLSLPSTARPMGPLQEATVALERIRAMVRADRAAYAGELASYYVQEHVEPMARRNHPIMKVAGRLGGRERKGVFSDSTLADVCRHLEMPHEAVEYYRRAFLGREDSREFDGRHAREAVRQALLDGDFASASFFAEVATATSHPSMRNGAWRVQEAIRALLNAEHDAAVRLEVAKAVWFDRPQSNREGALEATRFLSAAVESCRPVSSEVMREIIACGTTALTVARAPEELREWCELVDAVAPDELELRASARTSLASSLRRAGDREAAEQVLDAVLLEFTCTPAWADAAYQRALSSMERGDLLDAIERFGPLLAEHADDVALRGNARSPAKSYQRSAAMRVVECLLGLGRDEEALDRWVRAIRRYPARIGCGTCAESIELETKRTREFLEELTAIPRNEVCARVTLALDRLGPDGTELARHVLRWLDATGLACLTEALVSQDERDVRSAIQLLREQGDPGEAVALALVDLLRHPTGDIRQQAARVLDEKRLGSPAVLRRLQELEDQLSGEADSESLAIVRSIHGRLDLGYLLDALERDLSSVDGDVRESALERIQRLGAPAAPLVHRIIEYIADPRGSSPYSGSRALRMIGDAAIDPILDALAVTDANRSALAQAIGSPMFDASQRARLMSMVDGADLHGLGDIVRVIAAGAPSTIPCLSELLRDEREAVRAAAVRSLPRARGREELAAPLVMLASEDPSLRVRSLAIELLACDSAFETSTRTEIIRMGLQWDDSSVFLAALVGIRSLGDRGTAFLPELEQAVESHRGKRREAISRLIQDLLAGR